MILYLIKNTKKGTYYCSQERPWVPYADATIIKNEANLDYVWTVLKSLCSLKDSDMEIVTIDTSDVETSTRMLRELNARVCI